MKHQRVFAVFIAVALVSCPGLAQGRRTSSRLSIGGIDVQLGETQDGVLGRLRAAYDLYNLDDSPHTWLVRRKNGQHVAIIGTVSFENGKVAAASKDWDTGDDNTAGALSRALFNALAYSPNSGGPPEPCVATTAHSDRLIVVRFRCGARRISVTTSTIGEIGSASGTISEEIGGFR